MEAEIHPINWNCLTPQRNLIPIIASFFTAEGIEAQMFVNPFSSNGKKNRVTVVDMFGDGFRTLRFRYCILVELSPLQRRFVGNYA